MADGQKQLRKSDLPSWIKLGLHYGLVDDPSQVTEVKLPKKARRLAYDTIRSRLFDKVWDEMKAAGEQRPPFLRDLTKGRINDFAKTREIVRIVFVDMAERGMIRRTNEGFEVFLSNRLDPLSLRSALAHEIGHTYFYPVYQKNTSYDPQLDTQSSPDWKYIEGPVYEVARQILIPQQYLLSGTIGLSASIPKFHTLRRLFDATRDFLAARLVRDLQLWDVYLTWFRIPRGNFTYHRSSLEKSLYHKLAENVNQTHRGPSFRNMKRKEFTSLIAPAINESLTNLLQDSTEENNPKYLEKPIIRKGRGKRNEYLVEIEYGPSNSLMTLMLKKRTTDS